MYKNILHATDLSENHFDMCQKAAEIARCFHAKLFIIHVIQAPASLQIAQGLGFAELEKPMMDDAIAVMRTLGDALNIPSDQQRVEVGSIKQHILHAIKEFCCELVIVGSHTTSHLPNFLGSTAHAIVHHASCDVLTLRNDD